MQKGVVFKEMILAAVAGNLQLRTGSEAAALSFGLLDGLLDTFQVALEPSFIKTFQFSIRMISFYFWLI